MFRVFLLLALSHSATAQIVSEGTALAVGFEAEAAAQVEWDAGAVTVTGPSALARVALAPRVELRVGLPDAVVVRADGASARDVSDPTLGLKLDLGAPIGWALAALAEVSVPLFTGSLAGPASPSASLLAERLGGPLLLLGQADVVWDRSANRVDAGGAALVGAEVATGAALFAEAAVATTPDGLAVLALVSAALAATGRLAFDAHVGAGLTPSAPDAVVGVGASLRL
ncbi:hypothetical protein [Rubrivirga sp. IMCC45206]|uniref:hypothetical protein n=1 Tax=Rubrivirga sp. IMCC45206 TaxID=3391614 RepID=UPI00398FC212